MANIEPWSAEGKYDNYCVIGPLTSYSYKTIDIEATYRIRNVENTQHDSNPYGSFLPICQVHNNPAQNAYYFRTDEPMWAVVMQKFMPVQNLQSALLSLAESAEGDGDIEFDVKKYCEENGVEVKDMYFE